MKKGMRTKFDSFLMEGSAKVPLQGTLGPQSALVILMLVEASGPTSGSDMPPQLPLQT